MEHKPSVPEVLLGFLSYVVSNRYPVVNVVAVPTASIDYVVILLRVAARGFNAKNRLAAPANGST
jgi:hypothetical protein